MTPKLTMTTTAFVRVLSAVGALSVPMAIPSMGASADFPAVDLGMPSSIEGSLAQMLAHHIHHASQPFQGLTFSNTRRMTEGLAQRCEVAVMSSRPCPISHWFTAVSNQP